jgi:hypothetical protein
MAGVRKKAVGRRKPLKRLDSAMKMEGFNLDFLPVFLGFPSGSAWISFRKIWISFRGVWKSSVTLANGQCPRALIVASDSAVIEVTV